MRIDNKIIIETKLILSKKQLYIYFLHEGLGEKDALEFAEYYFNKPEEASKYFLNEGVSYATNLFNFGLLCEFKNSGETIEDEDTYYCCLTLKKHIVKSIELELVDVDKKYIDEECRFC